MMAPSFPVMNFLWRSVSIVIGMRRAEGTKESHWLKIFLLSKSSLADLKGVPSLPVSTDFQLSSVGLSV